MKLRTLLPATLVGFSLAAFALLHVRPSQAQSQTPKKPPAHVFHGFSEPEPIDFNDHAGWTSLFDGSSLNGWDGDKNYWHVENGTITVESTCERPTGTIYLVWQMKGEGGMVNSGIQYRSGILPSNSGLGPGGPPRESGNCPSGQPRGTPPSHESQAKWDMFGPQFDFDGRNLFTGQFYEQATGRGIIAWRGEVVHTEEGKKPRLLASLGNRDELGGYVKVDDWNQLHLIARGHQMTHIINGHTMAMLVDDDPSKYRSNGLIGFEIEGYGKMYIRNIWIKKL
jgi:hypothetical protein